MAPAMAQAPGTPINEGTISQQFIEYVPVLSYVPPSASSNPCSCLASVQEWIPEFPKGIGSFRNFTPPFKDPYIGAVIVTNEGPVDHGGMVVSFTHNSVTFKECNYSPCSCGTRTLPLDSPLIRGYR